MTQVFDNLHASLLEAAAADESLEIEMAEKPGPIFVVAASTQCGRGAMVVELSRTSTGMAVTVHGFADRMAGEPAVMSPVVVSDGVVFIPIDGVDDGTDVC